MNWSQIGTEIIISLAGVIISALGVFITYLINKYIKDQKTKDIINSLHQIVRDSVLYVYQTYVEELKNKDIFDKDAQKQALERCLQLIKVNMSQEIKTWLEANVGDITAYLKSLIESQIGLLKNSGGK